MDWIKEHLKIDPETETEHITMFLRGKLEESGKAGLLLGLSGGLDSAVVAYLAVRAVGPEKVSLLNLPDRDSKPRHIEHAKLIAEDVGVPLQTQNLTPILQEMGVYDLLPLKAFPGQKLRAAVVVLGKTLAGPKDAADLLAARFRPPPKSWVAKGNAYAIAKHRLRMVQLYLHADVEGLMVIGAANRTEYLTGTFSHWGCDHCADLMPILHLYRSQLILLAKFLNIPEKVRTKAADPDILPGIDDKELLLGTFEITDQILWGFEHSVSREKLTESYGTAEVAKIAMLMERSRPMRETPYALVPS